MSQPFDVLRERLLRAGIAPRHVRRYLRELSEHLADLTAKEIAAGYDAGDAALRARAALGSDDELAEAMISRREFRSVAVRAPWAVFGLAPPILTVAALTGLVLFLGLVLTPLIGIHHSAEVTPPGSGTAQLPRL